MERSLGRWVLGVFGVYVVIVVLVCLLLFGSTPRLGGDEAAQLTSDLEQDYALSAFSAGLVQQNGDGETNRVERRREVQRELLGPVVPVNCNTTKRLCVTADNCKLFCKDAAVVPFDCDQGVCVERALDASRPADTDDESPCDKKNGEYGLLVGYNELGVATWECVQLYPGWQDRSKYCEGGTVDLDTRVRAPSYADCMCPSGTTRIVYKRSVLGQVTYGLPHCIPNAHRKFYSLSYDER